MIEYKKPLLESVIFLPKEVFPTYFECEFYAIVLVNEHFLFHYYGIINIITVPYELCSQTSV